MKQILTILSMLILLGAGSCARKRPAPELIAINRITDSISSATPPGSLGEFLQAQEGGEGTSAEQG